MKIAVAIDSNAQVFKGHFGSAAAYKIYDVEGKLIEEIENPHDPRKTKVHHDNPSLIIALLPQVGVFIGRKFGEQSAEKLRKKFGIIVWKTESILPSVAIEEFLLEHETSE